MPLPTIQEQREIGKVLDTLTKGIQLNIEMSKTLEAMAQSIFKSWFVDFEPVKAKMAGMIPKGIDAASAEIFPDSMESSVSGLIPSGWRVSSLGRVLSALESGKRPKGGAQENGVPSIGAESVRGIGQFNYSATKYVPRDFYQAMPTGKVQPYDVLVYKDGAGAGSYVSMFGEGFPFEEYAINEHVFLLRSSDLPQSYLYHWLNQESIKNLMIELAQKSAQPGLNQQDTKSIPILVPSEDALVAFAGLVDPFLRAIMRNSNKNKTLQGIRDSLLPKLISGELNISEDTIAS
jgi:type I restriction enzyme S subunit